MITTAYKQATQILKREKKSLVQISTLLLEKETIDGDEFLALFDLYQAKKHGILNQHSNNPKKQHNNPKKQHNNPKKQHNNLKKQHSNPKKQPKQTTKFIYFN